MKYYICFLIVLLLFVCLCQFNNSNSNSESINNIEFTLYYTNWCGYSERFLENVWKDLEIELYKLSIPYRLVDGDKNENECIKNNIKGFPTILITKNNKVYEYKGKYELADILSFIKN